MVHYDCLAITTNTCDDHLLLLLVVASVVYVVHRRLWRVTWQPVVMMRVPTFACIRVAPCHNDTSFLDGYSLHCSIFGTYCGVKGAPLHSRMRRVLAHMSLSMTCVCVTVCVYTFFFIVVLVLYV